MNEPVTFTDSLAELLDEVLRLPQVAAALASLPKIAQALAQAQCDRCRDTARTSYHRGRHSCGGL